MKIRSLNGTKRSLAMLAGLACLVAVGTADAGGSRHRGFNGHGHHARSHHGHHHGHHREHHYGGHHYSGYPAFSAGFYVPPRVVYQPYYAPPVYARVYPQPVYPVQGYGGYGGYRAPAPNFGTAVGGALGGYLGSQVGHGSGRLAATAAGAVFGAMLGGQTGAGYR